jgi:1-acyl-sn-glycerol-3-phosphate acyltransferase
MSLLDSVRVLGAMARITAPSLLEMLRDDLERTAIDDRARWFGNRVVELLDVDLRVEGARVPADRTYVYMSNHQSHLDIPMLYATLPSRTIRMLAKKELFKIPLWGRGLRAAEFIEVDRGNHEKALASIDHAARLLRDGVSIYLAPEGTRSRDGKIGKLKKGGFHLALGTGAPIVPVAIRGTIDILPRGGKVMQKGRRVDATIGAPIDTTGRDLESLMAEVRDFLVKNVEIALRSSGTDRVS